MRNKIKITPLTPEEFNNLQNQKNNNLPNEKIKPIGYVNKLSGEFGVTKEVADVEDAFANQVKSIDKLSFTDGANEDEKDYLKSLISTGKYTPAQIENAKNIVIGNHPKQEGFQTWYFDDKTGLPQPLAPGQKAPEGKRIESVWGAQAEDESIGKTIAKNLANTIPNFIESLEGVGNLAQGLITGQTEADWYKASKSRLEALKFTPSAKSQEEIFNTENINSFKDILDPERFNFTAENVAGVTSQALSSIAEFMGANLLTGGLGNASKLAKAESVLATAAKGSKAAAVASSYKTGLLLKQIAASSMINMGEVSEMAKEAGLEGRTNHLFSLLTTLPIAFVETNLGITGKILNDGTARQAKKEIAKKVLDNFVVKGTEGGLKEVTEESLKAAYKESIAGAMGYAQRYAKGVIVDNLEEATEEVLQAAIRNGAAQLYDNLFAGDAKIGEGKFGKEALSAESFSEYINDAIGGFLGAGPMSAKRNINQSISAYRSVVNDEGKSLKAELENAFKNKKITEEELMLGKQKIDSFNSYNKQLKDAKIDLDDVKRRKVFDLTFSNENLKTQIEMFEANPTGINEGLLAQAKKTLSANQKAIGEILKPGFVNQQTTVADEVKAEMSKEQSDVMKEANAALKSMQSKKGKTVETTKKEISSTTDEVKTPSIKLSIGEEFQPLTKRKEYISGTKEERAVISNKEKEITNDYYKTLDLIEENPDIKDKEEAKADARKEMQQKRLDFINSFKPIKDEKESEINDTEVTTEPTSAPETNIPITSETEIVNQPAPKPTPVKKEEVLAKEAPEDIADREKREAAASSFIGKPIKQIQHEDIVGKLKKVKSKKTSATIISLGEQYNNQKAVKFNIGKEDVFATIASSATKGGKKGKYGLMSELLVGEKVELKLIPKEEWNKEGTEKDPEGNVYGDKVSVIKNGKLYGELSVTNWRKLAREGKLSEKPVEEVKTEKQPTPEEVAKKIIAPIAEKKGIEVKEEDTAKGLTDKLKKIKKQIQEEKEALKKSKKESAKSSVIGVSPEDIALFVLDVAEKLIDGTISINEALKQIRSKFKEGNLPGSEELRLQNYITKVQNAIKEGESIPQLTDEEKTAFVNDSLNATKGMSIGTDKRVEDLKATVRNLYSGIDGFDNDSQIEDMLISYFTAKEPFETDLKAGIEKIHNEGKVENNERKLNLAQRLYSLSNNDMIKLNVIFKSLNTQPYLKYEADSKDDNFQIVNSKFESSLIDKIRETLSKMSDEQYKALYNKTYKSSDMSKPALFDYFNKVTGLNKNAFDTYLNSKSFKNESIAMKTLQNLIIRGQDREVNGRPAFQVDTKEKLLVNLTVSKRGAGSVANTISKNTPFLTKLKVGVQNRFKNVAWNQKAASEFKMHLTDTLNSVLTDEKFKDPTGIYADNSWLQGVLSLPNFNYFFIDGGFTKDKSAEAGTAVEKDLKELIARGYNNTELGEDYYLQNIGQFGDKDRLGFVPAKKYKTEKEAGAKFKELMLKYGKNPEAEWKLLAKDLPYWNSILGTDEKARLFLLNYANNWIELNDVLNGNIEDYAKPKKGLKAIVDLIKRGGSVASPGIVLNQYVDGGVGKELKILVVNKPIAVEEDDFAFADGQAFVSRDYSSKVKKSSGGMFDTILKGLVSNVQNGKRNLIKANAIVIDELSDKFKDNEAYSTIKALLNSGKVDMIVTKDGAKYHNSEELKIFDDKGKVVSYKLEDKHILTVPTNNYYLQQDLRHDGKLREGSTPIQRIKNMMEAASSSNVQKMYNNLGSEKIRAYIDNIKNLSEADFTKWLLSKLKYNEQEIKDAMSEDESIENPDADYIENLITKGVSFNHIHVNKWLNTFIANIITKEALGRVTNKGLFVEMAHIPSKDFELKPMRKVNGKVLMPEIAISEKTGLRGPETFNSYRIAIKKIQENKGTYIDMFNSDGTIREHEIENIDGKWVIPGDIVLVTRIPADNMHSHSLARIKHLLPAAMENVIITNYKVQKIAGADFDGDQRTVEGLFRSSEGKAIKTGKYGDANTAFRKEIEWYYDPKNFDEANSEIDTKAFDKYLPPITEVSDYSATTFISSRIQNNVGLAVVGTMANLQAVYDYLRKHNSFLKERVDANGKPIPALTFNGNKLNKFITGEDGIKIKLDIGNLLNMALDNVKDPKIERLGLNEVTAKMFVGSLMLGVSMDEVVTFFTSKEVKDYVKKIRDSRAINSIENEFEILNNLPNGSVKNTLKQLSNIARDFDKIHNLIRSTEQAKKTWADYTYGNRILEAIQWNKLKYIDTKEFASSEFVKMAEESLKATRALYYKMAPENTELSMDLFYRIEQSKTDKDGNVLLLSKQQIVDFSNAIQKTILSLSRGKNESFKKWGPAFVSKIEEYKKKGKYSEIVKNLEINNDDISEIQFDVIKGEYVPKSVPDKKVVISQNIKDSIDLNAEKELLKGFEELSKSDVPADREFLKELVDYASFKFGLSQSRFSGSYASFFPVSVHKQIGKDIDAVIAQWNDDAYMEQHVDAVLKNIQDNVLSLNPKYIRINDTAHKAIKKAKPLFEPFVEPNRHDLLVPEKQFNGILNGENELTLKLSGLNKDVALKIVEGDNVTIRLYENQDTTLNKQVESIKHTATNVTLTLKDVQEQIQQQKKSYLPTPNKKVIDKIVFRLQKAIPKATVIYDNTIEGAGQVDTDGKTVRINPGYSGLDTPIHEFGHILIDALGGIENPIIKQGIEQLKGTSLWESKALAYPELSEDMLGKEILSEAIGREGVNIFTEKEKESSFKSWLSTIFFKLKRMLGLEKNIAKNIAMELLSGKDLGLTPTQTGIIQKQKSKETANRESKMFREFLEGAKDAQDVIDEEGKEFTMTDEQKRKKEMEEFKMHAITDYMKYADAVEAKKGNKVFSYLKLKEEMKRLGQEYIETEKKWNEAEKDSVEEQEAFEKMKEIRAEINDFLWTDKEYQDRFETYKRDLDEVAKIYISTNWEEMELEDLKNLYEAMKGVDMLAANPIVSKVYDKMYEKIGRERFNEIKAKNPEFEYKGDKSDISPFVDVYFKPLTGFSEEHLEEQYLAKMFQSQHLKMVQEQDKYQTKVLNAVKAVIKEQMEAEGIKGKALGFIDPRDGSNAKYFKFLTDNKGLIDKKSEAYKKLMPAQKEFVDVYYSIKSTYADISGYKMFGDNGIIKIEETFTEYYQRRIKDEKVTTMNSMPLMAKLYLQYIGKASNTINAVELDFVNPINGKKERMSFGRIKDVISQYAEGSKFKLLSRVKAIYLVTKYKKEASLQVKSSEYQIEGGKIRSRFDNSGYMAQYSEDHGKALIKFIEDMTFIKHMSPILPIAEAIEMYENTNGRKNLSEHIRIWKEGNILKSVQEGLGKNIDPFISFLRHWTHLRVMGFNYKAGGFNVLIGKYNQFRGQDVKYFANGETRYWMKGKESFNKSQAVAKRFKAVSTQIDYTPRYNVKTLLSDMAFGITALGENYIQVAGFVGQFTDTEWSWLDKDGKIIGKDIAEKIEREQILTKKAEEYKRNIAKQQGRYSENEKRNFAHFEWGRALMQFKVWMPDAYRERFRAKMIDLDGNEVEGTFSTFIRLGIKGTLKLITDKKEREKLFSSNEVTYVNARKQIKSAVALGALMAMYLGASDDDDDKELAGYLNKAIKDMSFVMNMDSHQFLLSTPVASLSTASDALKVIDAVFTLEQYKSSGKNYKEGDYKALNQLPTMLPYKNLWGYMENMTDEE